MTVTLSILFPTAPRRARGRAFTLVEILMAVGILAVLIGMSVIGFRYLSANTKAAGTDVAIKALQAMTSEFKNNGNEPKRRLDNSLYTGAKVAAPATSVEVGQPGYTSDAVLRTRQVLRQLVSIPSNKKMLADLPADLRGEETSDGPLVLDSHHCPIIYVPFNGLTGVTVINNAGQTIFSPEGAGFWASAGQDGNFSTGDDNQYSWQK